MRIRNPQKEKGKLNETKEHEENYPIDDLR